MTILSNQELFKMIFVASITQPVNKSEIHYYEVARLTDTDEKRMAHWLRGATDNLFQIVKNRFSCFTFAVFLRNQQMIKTMLDYAKKHNKNLDFSKPAYGRNTDCNMNVLQYVFKYGEPNAFKACCLFIGNADKVKELMNHTIERTITLESGGTEIQYSTIWEESLLSLALSKMAYDHDNLNEAKYDAPTIKFLKEYFIKWRALSEQYSSSTIKSLQEEWKIFADKYNNENRDKNPLPLENDALNDPIEFIFDPYFQFNKAIVDGMIDAKTMGTCELNIVQMLEILSKEPTSEENINAWEVTFRGLISRYQGTNPVRVGEFGVDHGLKSMHVTIKSNMVEDKMPPIPAKIMFDFRRVYEAVLNMVEKQESSKNDELLSRMRKHSAAIRKLDESVNQMVEGRRHEYERKLDTVYGDTEKNRLVKAFFSDICNRTITHSMARQIAADGLFTVNPTTAAAKRAKVVGGALRMVAEAIPISGASLVPTIMNIGINFVTSQYATKQSEGVSSTAAQINLPLLLVDLSGAITEMAMLMIPQNLDDDEQSKLTKKIVTAINGELDKLHTLEDKPDEEELRERLIVSAMKAVDHYMKHNIAVPGIHFLGKQRDDSGSQKSGYDSSDTNETSKTSGTNNTSKTSGSRKSGGPGCVMS